MITFSLDEYKFVWEALDAGLARKHWEELAVDKVIPLDMNHELYMEMESKGLLHIVTARNEGKIVGYHIGLIAPHLHYRSAGLMCYEDMYFILPEFRKGPAGAQLFMFVEKSLRERGITKWFLSCKVHQDHGPLFKALGFKLTDQCYGKVLTECKS